MLLRVRDPKTSTTGSRKVRKLPGLLPIQPTEPSNKFMNERLLLIPDIHNARNENYTPQKTTESVIDLSGNETLRSDFVNQAQFDTIDNCNRLNMHGRTNGLLLNSSHAFSSTSSVSTKIPPEKNTFAGQTLRSKRLLETSANQYTQQTNANDKQNIGWDRYSFKNGWPATKASQRNGWCEPSRPVVENNLQTTNTQNRIFKDRYFEAEVNTSQPPPYKRPCLFERKVMPSRSRPVTPVTSHPLFNTINAVIRQEIIKALETIAHSATQNVIRELEASAVTVTSQNNLQQNTDFNARKDGQQSMANSVNQNSVFQMPQNISSSPPSLQKNGYYNVSTLETNSRLNHRTEALRKCRPTPEQTEALSLVTCIPPSTSLSGICPATQEEAVNLTRPRISGPLADVPVDLSKASATLHLSMQRSFSAPNGGSSNHTHDVSRSILHSTSCVSPVSPLVYNQIPSCIGEGVHQTEIERSPLAVYVDHSPLDAQDDMDRYNAYNPDDDVSYCAESSDSTPNTMSYAQEEALTPQHLKKAKLMFFYARYPNTRSLKLFFADVKFTRATTSQLIKWFSNFREFYYIQVERFARQALTDGITDANLLQVARDSEVFRVLNLHYNKGNDFVVPSGFDETVRITLCEFFASIQAGKDRGPSWKKSIYKVIAKLDQEVPAFFKAPTL